MISLKDVRMSFGDINVLENISFAVDEGERISLLGPGGCGKSTILKILLGLLPPTRGAVELFEQDMVAASDDEKQQILKRVGMAFQQGALFDYMTVAQNIEFAMRHMTVKTSEEIQAKIKQLLDGVKLGRTADMYPFELSGGMQRRVGIARALATDPEVAIFDEPTSGLDPVTSTIILNMILQLAGQSSQKTLLVATSSVEIAIRFASRLVMINEGQVVADGEWRELLLTGPEWVRHFLGVRLIGLDLDYAKELDLPRAFIAKHW